MSAYFIVHLGRHDEERFGEYTRGVVRTIKPDKGWILAAGAATLAKGENELRIHNVILRFPTMKQAQGW